MSVTVLANVLSFTVFKLHSIHDAASYAATNAASVTPTRFDLRVVRAPATRSYFRTRLHVRRLPHVTCWNGEVVLDHPRRQDCPSRPAPQQAVAAIGYTIWDRIATCESRNTWDRDSGNGYFGGLQFDLQTWYAYDGQQFASRPDLATREQQIIVAERVRDGYGGYAARGYAPWPVCG